MRVLITGGAGFIGSHIADQLLSNGHEVAAVDNLDSGRRENLSDDVKLYVDDIRDKEKLQAIFDEVRPEAVCHQAAQMSVSRSVREPAFDAEVNVLGMLNVLDQCVRVEVKRVTFASSGGALYGDVTEPVGEDHPCQPIAPYGISKWVGEEYLKFYSREHGLQTTALRYTNVYGPRQNPHGEAGVVAIFCQKMLQGETATIFGDGGNVRDYVYVGDVARANVLALEQELPDRYIALNIGTGIGTDVNNLAAHIQDCCADLMRERGSSAAIPSPEHAAPRAGDLRSSMVSSQRAAEVLNWEPQVRLPDGLRTTAEWFANQVKEG